MATIYFKRKTGTDFRAFITHCFLFGTLIALERDDGEGFAPILGAIAHPAAGVALIGHRDGTRLYSADVTLTNLSSPVTRVEFGYVSGGNICVLALSGSTGAAFTPITVTGYNSDMIVEAAAPKYGALPGTTTATMDGGTANTSYTWYEAGSNPGAPNTGLPRAGTTFTHWTAPARRYTMAADYRTTTFPSRRACSAA